MKFGVSRTLDSPAGTPDQKGAAFWPFSYDSHLPAGIWRAARQAEGEAVRVVAGVFENAAEEHETSDGAMPERRGRATGGQNEQSYRRPVLGVALAEGAQARS